MPGRIRKKNVKFTAQQYVVTVSAKKWKDDVTTVGIVIDHNSNGDIDDVFVGKKLMYKTMSESVAIGILAALDYIPEGSGVTLIFPPKVLRKEKGPIEQLMMARLEKYQWRHFCKSGYSNCWPLAKAWAITQRMHYYPAYDI